MDAMDLGSGGGGQHPHHSHGHIHSAGSFTSKMDDIYQEYHDAAHWSAGSTGLPPAPWSPEEDEHLRESLMLFPESDEFRFEKLATMIPNRSLQEVVQRCVMIGVLSGNAWVHDSHTAGAAGVGGASGGPLGRHERSAFSPMMSGGASGAGPGGAGPGGSGGAGGGNPLLPGHHTPTHYQYHPNRVTPSPLRTPSPFDAPMRSRSTMSSRASTNSAMMGGQSPSPSPYSSMYGSMQLGSAGASGGGGAGASGAWGAPNTAAYPLQGAVPSASHPNHQPLPDLGGGVGAGRPAAAAAAAAAAYAGALDAYNPGAVAPHAGMFGAMRSGSASVMNPYAAPLPTLSGPGPGMEFAAQGHGGFAVPDQPVGGGGGGGGGGEGGGGGAMAGGNGVAAAAAQAMAAALASNAVAMAAADEALDEGPSARVRETPREEKYSFEKSMEKHGWKVPEAAIAPKHPKRSVKRGDVPKLDPKLIASRKGQPWSEEEHERFLEGLQKYGRGDWRSISRYCVRTRTPTQVASHAQKYFLRLAKMQKAQQK